MTVDIMHHEASYMLISVVMRHYKHIIMHYDCRYDALWMWALSKVLPTPLRQEFIPVNTDVSLRKGSVSGTRQQALHRLLVHQSSLMIVLGKK